MSTQIVYILSNPAMPGYIKIGFTQRELMQRLKDLDNTSVPVPFSVEYAREVDDARAVEKLLHTAFDHVRTRSNREFFELPIGNAIAALELASGRVVTVDGDSGLDAEAIQARNKASQRRERFSFKMVDISAEAQLHFYKDEAFTCSVVDNNQVLFEDEVQSLSKAALTVAHRLGYEWSTVSGPSCWCYGDETLEQRRWRFEGE